MKDNKTIIMTCLAIVILLFCMHSCLYNDHDGEMIYEPYAGGLYTEVIADSRESTTVPWEYINQFQIFYNDKALDSNHTNQTEYLNIAASVESVLCNTTLHPIEYDGLTEKEYQKNAEALFVEGYLNGAVKIQLRTEAKQNMLDDKLGLIMIRIGIDDQSRCHVFTYYKYRSDISLDCICNVYTIQDESAINNLIKWTKMVVPLA